MYLLLRVICLDVLFQVAGVSVVIETSLVTRLRENSEINGGNLRMKRSIVILHSSTWNLGMAEFTSSQINYHFS